MLNVLLPPFELSASVLNTAWTYDCVAPWGLVGVWGPGRMAEHKGLLLVLSVTRLHAAMRTSFLDGNYPHIPTQHRGLAASASEVGGSPQWYIILSRL